MASSPGKTWVELDGHRMSLTNLDKVLYPATGTTKAEVINYYAQVAPAMLPHVVGRPITRKRWPNGVDTEPFFQKNVDRATPGWIEVQEIDHRSGAISYPLADSAAALAWFGQNGALELHVPQWQFVGGRFTADGGPVLPGNPDRMVFDLDPGPSVGLADCAKVAGWVREVLGGVGLDAVPVTSGSKGLHLYVGVDRSRTSDEISGIAQQIAQLIESEHPDLVTSRMSKALRPGKVFIDWSQNNGNKTTIAPYSLRGRPRPTVAAVRTWDELADPELRHLEFDEVLRRLADGTDPMAALGRPVPGSSDDRSPPDPPPAHPPATDRLVEYRAKRSADRTPEPVPETGPQPHGADDTFVIQEHHARRLHWDLRLERNGVLASWAVPRGIPDTSSQNRLAVQTEDHPLEYAAFAGTIPAGEYGGGELTIWDAGTYETEKWWTDEIIVRFAGRRTQGRYVLVRTDGKNWLLHRMKDQSGRWTQEPEPPGGRRRRSDPREAAPQEAPPRPKSPTRPPAVAQASPAAPASSGDLPAPPTDLAPMLAAAGSTIDLLETAGSDRWRFEGKWDGIRAVVSVGGGGLQARSRTGRDITAGYPELGELVDLTAGHSVVLDGELVALDGDGRSNFGLLQQRMGLSRPADVRRLAASVPVHYFVFDILWLDGISLLAKPYDVRRKLLAALNPSGTTCQVPDALPGPAERALEVSAERGWEGIVAKRGDSPYRPGQRVHSWIKIKNVQMQDAVIVGFKPGGGRRAGTIGSLLLGVYSNGGLTYVGKVGSGFTDTVLDDLYARLEPLRRKDSPVDGPVPRVDAKDAVWVDPELVGEVRYGEWTHDRRLRHPVWRGLRTDVLPRDVHLEPEAPPRTPAT